MCTLIGIRSHLSDTTEANQAVLKAARSNATSASELELLRAIDQQYHEKHLERARNFVVVAKDKPLPSEEGLTLL